MATFKGDTLIIRLAPEMPVHIVHSSQLANAKEENGLRTSQCGTVTRPKGEWTLAKEAFPVEAREICLRCRTAARTRMQ